MASSSSCASSSSAASVAQASAPEDDPYLDKFVLVRVPDLFKKPPWSKWWREVFVFAKSSVDGCYYGYARREQSGYRKVGEHPTERLDIEGQSCAVVLGLDAARQAPTGILDKDVFWIRAPPSRNSDGEFLGKSSLARRVCEWLRCSLPVYEWVHHGSRSRCAQLL